MSDSNKPPRNLDDLSDEELAQELARRRAERMKQGGMLAAEEATEQHAHSDSLQTLEQMCRQRMQQQDDRPKSCPRCGKPAPVKTKNRRRTVRTMSGQLVLRRHYHYCERCQQGFYPLDRELGLSSEGELSPKMTARVLDFGVTTVFSEAAERWNVHHSGSMISENLVRLVVQRAGQGLEQPSAAVRQQNLRSPPVQEGTPLVVQADGSMLPMREQGQWKEVKVGVIYNPQHQLAGNDNQRGAITEARYAASVQGIDDFRAELDAALQAEGALQTASIAWLGDGAPWIWALRDELCPSAIGVLDFMHMAEHATDCGKVLFGEQSPWVEIWTQSIVERIHAGHVKTILHELRELALTLQGPPRQAVDDLIRYYETNACRMDYPRFRQLGLPIGSGAVESAHRHVIQNRMKLAGQHWSPPRAHRMARLRAAYSTTGPEHFSSAVLPMAEQAA
jgi:hypothetical protein